MNPDKSFNKETMRPRKKNMHRTIQPLFRISKTYVVNFLCTHLISGRTARSTSCAFAACVAARALLNVAGLYCVAVCCAVLVFVDYVMVCILHAVTFPHYVLCAGLNADITVMFSIPCCPALLCSVLFCFAFCLMSCAAYLLSILSCLGLIHYGLVVLVCSAMSSYGMLRASPILSCLFSVLVCVVHVGLPYV